MKSNNAHRPSPSLEVAALTVLVAAALLMATFVILRYGGLWGETDTANFARVIRSMAETGKLVPGAARAYPHGYGYQSFVVMLQATSGISLQAIQLIVAALLVSWLVIPAWLLFRELTGSSQGALLATVLLLLQPELLFPILRGTHEKFTRGLMILALFVFVRSILNRQAPRKLAPWLFTLYLLIFAMITFNVFLATTFIAAIGLALIIGVVASRIFHASVSNDKANFNRFIYAIVISLGLAFLFAFYVYMPAQQSLHTMTSILDRLAALLLDVEIAGSQDPYQTMFRSWVSVQVYLLLSLANWLILGASVIIWLYQSARWALRRDHLSDERYLLLWSFFTAFAAIGAVSIVADLSGGIAGNLQLRNFPSFIVLAVAIVARTISTWHPKSNIIRRFAFKGVWLATGLIAIFSLLKATNEPAFSNWWLFYRPSEMMAIDWSAKHLTGRSVWTDFDARIRSSIEIQRPEILAEIYLDAYNLDSQTRDVFVSDVTRLRSKRTSQPLPTEADSLQTYDNGQSQIYHIRPVTQFQQ